MIFGVMHSLICKALFNMMKSIKIQRNVVSGIANMVIVCIMKVSNFLHDVWFDIFFLIESKLSNLCILKILQSSKHHDMSVHRLFSTHGRVFNIKGIYPAIFNTSEINSENF